MSVEIQGYSHDALGITACGGSLASRNLPIIRSMLASAKDMVMGWVGWD